jgi:threonine synthase
LCCIPRARERGSAPADDDIDLGNVHNIALEGSFDDAQNIVKALFADREVFCGTRIWQP